MPEQEESNVEKLLESCRTQYVPPGVDVDLVERIRLVQDKIAQLKLDVEKVRGEIVRRLNERSLRGQ